MLPEDTLFNAVSTSISRIVRLKTEGKDIGESVKETLATIDEIEMEVSFPEQQASGSAIIIAAKFMLPDMTVDEKLTVAPLFHSALELISSFDKISTIRWNTVLPLFHHYMYNIPRESPSTVKYMEVVRKIFDVMKLSRTVTDDFFSFENLVHISRIIQTSLVYAKNPDGDLALKKLSIDLLSRVVRQCPPEKAPVVGVLISGYLAGLLKIINTQNVADVIENAIIIFTDAVILVFDNDAERFDINQIDKTALRKVMPVILEKHDDKWLKNAEKMVFEYAKNILERHMRNRAHNVKMAVCQMVMQIQCRCTKMFGTQFYDYLLFIYTNLRYDEAVYFQDLSKSCLTVVVDRKVVEAYFYKELEEVCRRLPVQTRSGHGDRELKILSAVLDGLGEAVSLMCTMESPIIEKVIRAIVDCIEINKKGMQITSEGMSTSIDQELKKFKMMHNLNHGPLKNVARILAELGKFEIVHVVHNLMKVESARRRSSYHLLLAYILFSLKKKDASPDEPTIMMLAEYLVKESNRSCVIYLKDDDKPKTDTLEHDWNTCIEGLSCINVAFCMKFVSGDANRSKIIIASICTILNQSICSSWIGVESADFALKIIADYDDKVSDVLELVNRYSAYILNQVSLSCSSSNNYHVAPVLLRAYLRYDNIDDKFDSFRVIIEKMLYALDNNEQKYTIALLQALQAFTAAVNKEWMDLQPIDPPKESEDQRSLPTPQHILVEKILLRTKHMLTSPKLPLQLNCLQILIDGLDIMKNYDDMLLPMIHQNWSGIMTVMKARDPRSMIPAIEVVAEMAVKSGTFVHNKVLKEMWPAVGPYLIHCFEHIHSWQFSDEYRMVLKVIEIMPHLVANIGLTEQETRDSFMVLLNIAIDNDGDFTMISRTQKSQIERHFRDLATTGRNTNN